MTLNNSLVSVDWLSDHLNSSQLILLDATWFLPKFQRSGQVEFLKEHIEGAQFFDYDQEVCDKDSPFPRMMPSAAEFEKVVQKLGVCQDSVVVIYDNNEMFSSPRAWWMFKAMGTEKVAVLNGGLVEWKKAGFPTVNTLKKVEEVGDFKADLQKEAFVDSNVVLERLRDPSSKILDARAKERFDDAHMPGAGNLPYTHLLNSGKMKSSEELKAIYSSLLSKSQCPTFSCGSGVTACILALGADQCGLESISVYDASWSEWGQSENFPKEKS
jgi:thiosulfate/3-mercaptopyruvate sulfurtransferase